MDQFVLTLTNEVQKTLHVIESEETDVIRCAERSIAVLEQAFADLRTFTISYTFENEDEEIRFFKELKPKLFSVLIYYRKVYDIEMDRPKGGEEEERKYLKWQLCLLKDYFDRNREFYKYYRSSDTHMDTHYFLRQKPTIHITMESFYFERDPLFSTAADFKMAKVTGNDRVEKYLSEELAKLNHSGSEGEFFRTTLVWTGNKNELIELVIALSKAKRINFGKLSQKDMIRYAEQAFNIDLGNYSRTYCEMQNRKNVSAFLDYLRKLLNDDVNDKLK